MTDAAGPRMIGRGGPLMSGPGGRRFRLKDPNVRPAEAARLRRLAGQAAAGPGATGFHDRG